MSTLTYPEAAIIGLLQGVTELFPVSSLGHSVLLPAIIGGQWARDLSVSAKESPYLAFIVGLHVATALALMIYFWREWVRIIGGFFSSIRDRQIVTADQRIAFGSLCWQVSRASAPSTRHHRDGKPPRRCRSRVGSRACRVAGPAYTKVVIP